MRIHLQVITFYANIPKKKQVKGKKTKQPTCRENNGGKGVRKVRVRFGVDGIDERRERREDRGKR